MTIVRKYFSIFYAESDESEQLWDNNSEPPRLLITVSFKIFTSFNLRVFLRFVEKFPHL
jgi:hypothetical protein